MTDRIAPPANLNAILLRRLARRFDQRGLHRDAAFIRLAVELARSDDTEAIRRAGRILRDAQAFLAYLDEGHPDPRTTNGATP